MWFVGWKLETGMSITECMDFGNKYNHYKMCGLYCQEHSKFFLELKSVLLCRWPLALYTLMI